MESKFIEHNQQNSKIVSLYNLIKEYFTYRYPNAVFVDTQNYFAIKGKGKNNKIWFSSSYNDSLLMKARRNSMEKGFYENVDCYIIDSYEKFLDVVNKLNMKDEFSIECTFEDVVNDINDKVRMYAIGSCNQNTRLGKCTVLLEYKLKYKVINMEIENTTVNSCIISGILKAISLLKKPCDVQIITSTPLGFVKAKKGKGRNIDLPSTHSTT